MTSCAAGVALMFGRNSARHLVRYGRRLLYRKDRVAATDRPHLARESGWVEAARRREFDEAGAGGRTLGT